MDVKIRFQQCRITRIRVCVEYCVVASLLLLSGLHGRRDDDPFPSALNFFSFSSAFTSTWTQQS